MTMKQNAFYRLALSLFAALTLFSNGGAAKELIIIKSGNLKCNDTILVFTPQYDDRSDREPVATLFLLHGWSGCHSDWSNKYDLQQISNSTGFRIICPDGFYNSWYLNDTDTTKMQWRDFFHKELYPLIREKYGIRPENTFITGLSMGGHGAVNIFLDNIDNFRACGSMSGVLNLQLSNLRDREIKKVVGEKIERYDSESAVTRIVPVARRLKEENKPIIVSCGYQDTYSGCAEEFSAKCRELQIPHILLLSPGNHSWKYWGFALREHIALFTKILSEENLGY